MKATAVLSDNVPQPDITWGRCTEIPVVADLLFVQRAFNIGANDLLVDQTIDQVHGT